MTGILSCLVVIVGRAKEPAAMAARIKAQHRVSYAGAFAFAVAIAGADPVQDSPR